MCFKKYKSILYRFGGKHYSVTNKIEGDITQNIKNRNFFAVHPKHVAATAAHILKFDHKYKVLHIRGHSHEF